MLKQHAKIVYQTLLVTDIGITIASFFVSYWFRNTFLTRWDMGRLYPLERYTWLLTVIVPAWFVLLKAFHAYRSYRTASFLDELSAVGKAAILGGFLIGAIAFATKSDYISRIFIFSFVVINILMLGAERFAIRAASWAIRKRGYNFRNVIIVGTEATAQDIARRIRNYEQWGLHLLGYISINGSSTGQMTDGADVIGSLTDLETIVKNQVVDEVIFAAPGKRLEDLEDTFLMLEEHGINARIVSNVFPHVIAKMRVEELETVPLLTFSTVPSNTVALVLKRLFDIVISLLLIILSAPIMLIAAMLIKAASPGPVLFRQKRSGLQGRVFTLYKFRSMYVDAEARRKEFEQYNEMDGPVFKMKDDPRITPVGRFLRKSSIDELPQLWNVLNGDMSIVGPRPPIPEEVAQYKRWQRRRLSMRPGLTCIWQISGRNKIYDFNEWARLDLLYIDTWSPALDIKIFLKTIPVVLFRKGAA
jgi:exopolysaccharide biosynthesis polyprenyl glycosylphosphotransferase